MHILYLRNETGYQSSHSELGVALLKPEGILKGKGMVALSLAITNDWVVAIDRM